jgi:hypothetical protein
MNKVKIDGISINLNQVAMENESLDQLKGRNIFPDGPAQDKQYAALWEQAEALQQKPVEVQVTVEKPKAKKGKK